MNEKIILSLVAIVLLFGILMFSPPGKKFKGDYLDKHLSKIGYFFRSITTRAVKPRLTEKRLEMAITDVSPVDMRDQEFTIKGSGVKSYMVYDFITVSGGNVAFPDTKVKIEVNNMIGKVSFTNNKMKISGRMNEISLNDLIYNKTDIDFLVVGVPIEYTLKDVRKDVFSFSTISGSLSWSGLKGISPLLQNDRLDLINFKGTVRQINNSVMISGSVSKIRLNGVDISLGR